MARNRRTAKVFALVALITPFLGTGLAGAAVNAPVGSDIWHPGETHSVTWDVHASDTGTAALYLRNGSGVVDADPSTPAIDPIAQSLDISAATTFSWSIPAGIAPGSYKIRLTGDTGSSPWAGPDEDSAAFSIAAVPAVTSPATGDHWQVGSTHSVTFTVPAAATGTAKLELFNGSGVVDADPTTVGSQPITPNIDISTATSFSWTLSDELIPGTYFVRLSGDNGTTPWAGTAEDSASFTIVAVPAVTSPAAGNHWHVGTTHDITFVAPVGATGNANLALYNGTTKVDVDSIAPGVQNIAPVNVATDTTFSWTVPADLTPATGLTIKLEGTGTSGGWTGSALVSDAFDIIAPYPTVGINAPATGNTWRVGQTKTVTFVAPEGDTGTATLSLYHGTTLVDLDPAAGQQDIATVNVATDTSASWTVPAAALGTGMSVKLHGGTGTGAWTGTAIDSGTFDIIPGPGITSPTSGDNWRVGETHSIGFYGPDLATGTVALYLWDGTANVDADPSTMGTQPIATGLDIATIHTSSWTIPAGITLSDTMKIRMVGDGQTGEWTGTALVSNAFVLRAAPPVAMVNVPAAGNSWHPAETHVISFVAPELATGTYALTLMNSSGPVDMDPVATGVQSDIVASQNIATTTTFSWTLPAGFTGTGLFVRVHGTTGSGHWTGANIDSGVFEIVPVGASNAAIASAVSGSASISEKVTINWKDNGASGNTVSLDLLRNDGGTGATTTAIAANLATAAVCNSTTHACSYIWTVSEKTGLDTGAGTYKVRVTPINGVVAKTTAFKVSDRALNLTDWGSNKTVKAGEPVQLDWVAAGDLGTLKIEATPATGKAIVLEAKFDASKGKYIWFPTFTEAPGTYTLKLTSTAKSAAKAAITATEAKTAAVSAATAFTLGSLVGPTIPTGGSVAAASFGQPIKLAWTFGETGSAPKAAIPVDLSLVDSAGKATKIVGGVVGDIGTDGVALRTYTYRPSAKLKAGSYHLSVTVTGATASTFTKTSSTFTLSAPTTIVVDKPVGIGSAAARIERGAKVDVEWTIGSKSETAVAINLLNTTTNKATNLIKSVNGAEGVGKGKASVLIPAKGIVAGTNYKIQVVSLDMTTLKADKAIEIIDPTLAITAPHGTGSSKVTMIVGTSNDVSWTLGSHSTATVKLDLIKAADKADPKAKVVVVVNAGVATTDGGSTVHFTPTAKVAPGDYVVRATAADISATAVVSDTFAIVSSAVATVTAPTSPRAGATVAIGWTLANEATDDVKIELFEGTTLAAKGGAVAKTATAYLGTGSFAWAIPTTVLTGSGHTYTLKVTSLSDPTKSHSSSTFTVAAAG